MSCPRCDGDAFDDLGCPDSYHEPLNERLRENRPSLYDLLGLTSWKELALWNAPQPSTST
jgi:hypothetical protein